MLRRRAPTQSAELTDFPRPYYGCHAPTERGVGLDRNLFANGFSTFGHNNWRTWGDGLISALRQMGRARQKCAPTPSMVIAYNTSTRWWSLQHGQGFQFRYLLTA
jgi:hypothetical protein